MKVVSLFSAALFFSSSAALASPVDFQVDVSAFIPVSDGLDISDVGGWASRPMVLNYNRGSEVLEPARGALEMKSGIGAITAYLNYPPKLVSGADVIDMDVSIGGVELKTGSAAAVEVANKADAAAGKRADLLVAAVAPGSTGYEPGNYMGIVHMTFESIVGP